MEGEEFKDSNVVAESSRRIATETSESAYIWDIERSGESEIVSDGNSVDYN